MNKHTGLSAWQLTMMAVGTVIGGSFFLGSSVAIHAAGPLILLSFIFGGILVYYILYALSEMTVANPDSGSFRTFAAQTFGPGTGYVVGWVYWTGMILAMSSESAAISILVREWFPNISIALLGSTIIILVTLLNLLGADKLSKLESGLAAVKLLAILLFIIIGFLLVTGLFPGAPRIGTKILSTEHLLPGGLAGLAGSMLLVMFSYAGFEIIGLASSEAKNPKETVPRAIGYTVICLVGFYVLSIAILLTLIPTADINESQSPYVASLDRWGISWAGTGINIVLITAILSTMLAAMFGLGRMMRSLAEEGLAPNWVKDTRDSRVHKSKSPDSGLPDVPYRGILFSGAGMLLGLWFGLLFPRVYLFLISSGGFALLFTYAVIMATHIRFRKLNGCPPDGKCQMRGYPYSSWVVLFCLILAIFSMPFVKGQATGLVAGIVMVVIYACSYLVMKTVKHANMGKKTDLNQMKTSYRPNLSTEFSDELSDQKMKNKEE